MPANLRFCLENSAFCARFVRMEERVLECSADEPHGLGRLILQHVGMVGHHVLHGSVCGSGLSGLQLVAVPRTSYDEQRIEVTAAGHLNPAGVTR